MAPNTPNVSYGKNARLYIIEDDGSGTYPEFDPTTWTFFCAPAGIDYGSEQGTETVNNFCTGGADVEMGDGSEKSTLELGDIYWAENDKSLKILKRAYKNGTNVHFIIFPLGLSKDGKEVPADRGTLSTNSWKNMIKSKGFIMAQRGLKPLNSFEEGTIKGTTFTPTDYTAPIDVVPAPTPAPAPAPAILDGGALTDNVAANLPDTQATQAVTYTLTSATQGDITAVTAGTSQNRTVDILDANGVSLATGANGATYAAAPAGTYTVRVGGPNANTGGTVTADYMA